MTTNTYVNNTRTRQLLTHSVNDGRERHKDAQFARAPVNAELRPGHVKVASIATQGWILETSCGDPVTNLHGNLKAYHKDL